MPYRYVPPKGRGFAPFWSEHGYRLCPFWSGIGYGFRGNYRVYERTVYHSFQFQMSEQEREMCDLEMDSEKSFFVAVLIYVMMT